MKIITMERRTMDGEPVYEEEGNTRDWWCVIETKEEEMVYDKAHTEGESVFYETIWDAMVNYAGLGMNIKWGDDDIYGYIRPDEMPPEVGDEYTDGDDDKWVRVE